MEEEISCMYTERSESLTKDGWEIVDEWGKTLVAE
jgi:hypothetical protein